MFPGGKERKVPALRNVSVLPTDPAVNPEMASGWVFILEQECSKTH